MQTTPPPTDPIALSARFLQAARLAEPTGYFLETIAGLDIYLLHSRRFSDNFRCCFWINLYNAFTLVALREQPETYNRKSLFFSRRFIRVAGLVLSLDDIEHGILRRSAWKWGLGYVRRRWVPEWERLLRVSAIDYRIHFALNCGAASCPPISVYLPDSADAQLDHAARSYLQENVRFDAASGQLRVPRLFLWFRGDFGGRRGILEVLRRYELVGAADRPRISYLPYDWSLQIP